MEVAGQEKKVPLSGEANKREDVILEFVVFRRSSPAKSCFDDVEWPNPISRFLYHHNEQKCRNQLDDYEDVAFVQAARYMSYEAFAPAIERIIKDGRNIAMDPEVLKQYRVLFSCCCCGSERDLSLDPDADGLSGRVSFTCCCDEENSSLAQPFDMEEYSVSLSLCDYGREEDSSLNPDIAKQYHVVFTCRCGNQLFLPVSSDEDNKVSFTCYCDGGSENNSLLDSNIMRKYGVVFNEENKYFARSFIELFNAYINNLRRHCDEDGSLLDPDVLREYGVSFTEDNEYHPHRFIQLFEAYVQNIKLSEFHKCLAFCVVNDVDDSWIKFVYPDSKYAELKERFMKKYCSRGKQKEAYNWFKYRFPSEINKRIPSRQIMQWIQTLRHAKEVHPFTIMNTIFRKLPEKLRNRLTTNDKHDIDSLIQRLNEAIVDRRRQLKLAKSYLADLQSKMAESQNDDELQTLDRNIHRAAITNRRYREIKDQAVQHKKDRGRHLPLAVRMLRFVNEDEIVHIFEAYEGI